MAAASAELAFCSCIGQAFASPAAEEEDDGAGGGGDPPPA